MWRITSLIIVSLLSVAAVAVLYGRSRWKTETTSLRERLQAARLGISPKVFDPTELEGLPDPVQRYFRTVLREGQPVVSAVRVEQSGTFNMNEKRNLWKPFTSDQLVTTSRPGFDWNARIAVAPFVGVRVHDAYVAGEGILYAKLLGLVKVAEIQGTPEAAHGELMRFLAEAAWYPTALLPSQGVRWTDAGGRSATATLSDGATTVTLLFRFGETGLIESVRSENRGRIVDDKVIPTPWEGHFHNYQQRHGMLIPIDGEVAWMSPDGATPYWRGHITRIEFEFAE